LTSTDAGALAKFTDLYGRMEGGALDLRLQTGGEASAGEATVTGFALRDEPAFRRIVAAAPAAPADTLDPTLVRFQKMTITFVRSPGTLGIKDAVIYNPYMGLTTAGAIDFAGGAIDLSGTFVPAYSVNTILTKIPLVGLLLGGSQNEGVFGITYRVQGSLSHPEMTVNPLSAIAPGILRKIVSAMDGVGARGGAPGEAVTSPSGPASGVVGR
jgi:hypothetical protein